MLKQLRVVLLGYRVPGAPKILDPHQHIEPRRFLDKKC